MREFREYTNMNSRSICIKPMQYSILTVCGTRHSSLNFSIEKNTDTTKISVFFMAEKERCVLQRVPLLVHPSLRLRYRTAHHFTKKLATGNFFDAKCPLGVQISFNLIAKQKGHLQGILFCFGGEGEILPVCGTRHLFSGSKSPRYLSTTAQPYALPESATGGGRARFPLAGARRSSSNHLHFSSKRKRNTPKGMFLFFGGEGEI